MNFLPILLIIAFLLKGNGQNSSNLAEFLKNINLSDLYPLLETFGINKTLLDGLSPDVLNNFQNGNINIASLLPLILPIINKFFQNNTNSSNLESPTVSEGLSPIKDVINDELYTSLEKYFST